MARRGRRRGGGRRRQEAQAPGVHGVSLEQDIQAVIQHNMAEEPEEGLDPRAARALAQAGGPTAIPSVAVPAPEDGGLAEQDGQAVNIAAQQAAVARAGTERTIMIRCSNLDCLFYSVDNGARGCGKNQISLDQDGQCDQQMC